MDSLDSILSVVLNALIIAVIVAIVCETLTNAFKDKFNIAPKAKDCSKTKTIKRWIIHTITIVLTGFLSFLFACHLGGCSDIYIMIFIFILALGGTEALYSIKEDLTQLKKTLTDEEPEQEQTTFNTDPELEVGGNG